MTSSFAPVVDSELLWRIENRPASVGVNGLNYVGLPLARLFNEQGFPVIGFNIDAKKVRVLEEGESYIYRFLLRKSEVRSDGVSDSLLTTR